VLFDTSKFTPCSKCASPLTISFQQLLATVKRPKSGQCGQPSACQARGDADRLRGRPRNEPAVPRPAAGLVCIENAQLCKARTRCFSQLPTTDPSHRSSSRGPHRILELSGSKVAAAATLSGDVRTTSFDPFLSSSNLLEEISKRLQFLG
jgi:hypothetical protein